MEGLTTDQLDKLRRFQEITNMEEPEMAIVTLASLDWNLERAIEAQLNDDSGNASQEPSSSNLPVSRSPLRDLPMEIDEPTFRPLPQVSNTAFPRASNRHDSDSEDDSDFFLASESLSQGTINSTRSTTNGGGRNEIPLIPLDVATAIEGTQNFISVFEARYGQNGNAHLMPPFFMGSLPAAIREAFECPDRPVSERRPLAIYLHDDNSIARNIFPTTVLSSEQVCNLLRGQFVVWPWDVTAKQNEQKLLDWLTEYNLHDLRSAVSRFLKDRERFPLLLLLTKDVNMDGTGSNIQLIEFVQGTDSPQQAVDKLVTAMDAYSTSKIAMEKAERERAERERLRVEQEEEYQQSLTKDRERAAKLEKEQKEAKDAEETARREEEEEQMRRQSLKSSLPPEPEEGAPNCVQIRFRLPEGGMMVRRFRGSDELSTVLSFLESEGFGADKYRMMNSDFPQKKDVSSMSHGSTLTQLKFPFREVINVEER